MIDHAPELAPGHASAPADRAVGQLSLRVFGPPQLLRAGVPVALSRRARGIIAYLALGTAHRVGRERLMGLFWPDRDEPQARASLRQCLVELRGSLGPAIDADREWVSLDLDAIDGDWRLINAALATGGRAKLHAAVTTIGDDVLLGGLEFGEAFDDWLRGRRADLDARLAAAVVAGLDGGQTTVDATAALALADAWLRRDPRDETVAAAAIAIEMRRQNPAAARRRFREIEALLKRDGDGPPGPALRAALAGGPDDAAPSTTVALALATELQLPSKPSIAILPFADLSSGSTHDDFADGMVEEICTVLARFSTLFVIAGQSSLSYRGSSKTAQHIARELGVRYLLEGSVRQANGRVRIAVKLVDAERGEQIWGDRFDGTLDNIFDLQDRVAVAVARTIDSTVTDAEFHRAAVRPTASPDAYELTLRANAQLNHYTRESMTEALALAEAAVALDPAYSWAVAVNAFAHAALWSNGWSTSPRASRAAARSLIARAVQLGPDDELTLAVAAGASLSILEGVAVAEPLIDRALELNPEKSYTLFWAGWLDLLRGRPGRGLERFEIAARANPRSAYRPFQLSGMGYCLFFLGRDEEAAIVLAEVTRIVPDYMAPFAVLVASLVRSGRQGEAAAAAARAGGVGRLRGGLGNFVDRAQVVELESALASLDPEAEAAAWPESAAR